MMLTVMMLMLIVMLKKSRCSRDYEVRVLVLIHGKKMRNDRGWSFLETSLLFQNVRVCHVDPFLFPFCHEIPHLKALVKDSSLALGFPDSGK